MPSQSPFDIIKIARHAARPTTRDFIAGVFDSFIEFHGDRAYGDDRAIIGGVAKLNETPVTVIGIQKGATTKENIDRNFGQPLPEGYRKALRLMKQAEKFGRPVITLINTPGAYCGREAEERGQGEAIARNLLEMSGLKTPVIAVLCGEGGSGGALALAVADGVYMLRYAVYSVLSPEGFAAILWKDSARAKDAAEVMRMTSAELLSLGVADGVIDEADGGCQNDPIYTYALIKATLVGAVGKLAKTDERELLDNRYERFRKFGSSSVMSAGGQR
jgi:acetyl-CoA carboxylase carboxyl transferase subunit alpha